MISSRPRKRSLTLNGHATSVSLEDPFWSAFRAIAERDARSINSLAAEIDAARGMESGLASAIRLFVLDDLQTRLRAAEGLPEDGHPHEG